MNDKPRLLHMTTVPQTRNFLAMQIGHAKVEGFDVHAVSVPEADLRGRKVGRRHLLLSEDFCKAWLETPLR